jgi:hypothetical protein
MAKRKAKSSEPVIPARSLTRDEILAVNDMRVEPVSTPEWGGVACVRRLSGLDLDRYDQAIVADAVEGRINPVGMRAKLVTYCLCNMEGEFLFPDRTEADFQAVGLKSGVALDRVFKVARQINGLVPGNIRTLIENLKKARAASSPTG